MTSSKQKGNRLELLAKTILKGKGYYVHRVEPARSMKTAYGWRSLGNNDLFGVFDLIAIHPHGMCKLIQVTTTSTHATHRKHKIDDAIPVHIPDVNFEIWAGMGERTKFYFRVHRRVGKNTISIVSDHEWMHSHDLNRKGEVLRVGKEKVN